MTNINYFYDLKNQSIRRKRDKNKEGEVTWISNTRKHWEKNAPGAGGALAVGGEAKGRAWGCGATTGQPGK